MAGDGVDGDRWDGKRGGSGGYGDRWNGKRGGYGDRWGGEGSLRREDGNLDGDGDGDAGKLPYLYGDRSGGEGGGFSRWDGYYGGRDACLGRLDGTPGGGVGDLRRGEGNRGGRGESSATYLPTSSSKRFKISAGDHGDLKTPPKKRTGSVLSTPSPLPLKNIPGVNERVPERLTRTHSSLNLTLVRSGPVVYPEAQGITNISELNRQDDIIRSVINAHHDIFLCDIEVGNSQRLSAFIQEMEVSFKRRIPGNEAHHMTVHEDLSKLIIKKSIEVIQTLHSYGLSLRGVFAIDNLYTTKKYEHRLTEKIYLAKKLQIKIGGVTDESLVESRKDHLEADYRTLASITEQYCFRGSECPVATLLSLMQGDPVRDQEFIPKHMCLKTSGDSIADFFWMLEKYMLLKRLDRPAYDRINQFLDGIAGVWEKKCQSECFSLEGILLQTFRAEENTLFKYRERFSQIH